MKPYALLALLPIVLAACGDEDRTQTGYTASLDKTSTSSDDTTTVPARAAPGIEDTLPAPPHPPRAAALTLSPLVSDSGAGTGDARSVGNATAVRVALTHGASGVSYAGAIREGGCARMGSTVASLIPATADSLGRAQAASDVPIPLDSLMGTPHVVVYGAGGRPQSCGPIPGSGAAPPADTAALP
jgi:hypothetical protein